MGLLLVIAFVSIGTIGVLYFVMNSTKRPFCRIVGIIIGMLAIFAIVYYSAIVLPDFWVDPFKSVIIGSDRFK